MELLAVISIIAILLTLGAVGISNATKGQGSSTGAAVAEALFEEARTIALSRGTTTRVVINNNADLMQGSDLQEQAKYRRQMMVIYKKVDPETGEETNEWVRGNRATMLPGKVFYSAVDSTRDETGTSQMPIENHLLDGGKGAMPVPCFYYEFNAEGICQTPGARFVVVEGVIPRGQTEPVLQGKNNKSGFVIWRNGRTSIFRGPDHMEKR